MSLWLTLLLKINSSDTPDQRSIPLPCQTTVSQKNPIVRLKGAHNTSYKFYKVVIRWI